MKYLLGIDNGGTFSKAALFDENGVQIAVSQNQTQTIVPAPGYTERDMGELWRATAACIKDTIAKSGINPKEIAGISFSGHGKGLYLVDEAGNPAYNGILSTDARAWKEVTSWYEDGTNQSVYPLSCQKILVNQPVSLLAWFKKHQPEVLRKTRWVFSVIDYIRFMLTGNANAEYTSASGTNLVNLVTKQYDQNLLNYFGIGEVLEKLPPLVYSAEVCGFVTQQASLETGLAIGTPVMAGMFDIDACAIASGVSDTEKLCMIAGTWSINEYISKEPVLNGTVALNSLYCIPGYYLIEDSSPNSAGNLEWFIQSMMQPELTEAKNLLASIYDKINAQVQKISPDDSKLIFLPYLNGTSSDPLAKGSFIGLTTFHSKAHLLRAVYEGVAFNHRDHLENLLKNREKPNAIRLAGGAAKSDTWVQIFADILQIPIEVLEDKELGAQGAAIAAGIGAGIYQDYDGGIERVVKIRATFEPQTKYHDVYNAKYLCYQDAKQALRSIWKHFEN